eukprot:1670012-Pleurochrysis_carterae.AAC.1
MRLGIVKDAIGGKSQDASALLDATNAVLNPSRCNKRRFGTAGGEERQQIDSLIDGMSRTGGAYQITQNTHG